MKLISAFFIIFFITSCNKPKVVLICGDHICVNNAEAELFFEENLSIEVKILEKKTLNEFDLVELNLKESKKGKKEVRIFSKEKTSDDLKILSNKEKKDIIENINTQKKNKKIVKKIDNNILKKKKVNKQNVGEISQNKEKKDRINVIDICTIIDKCNIDEISKYLIKEGKNKKFPDITLRQ